MRVYILSDGVPCGDSLAGIFELDQAEALQNAGNEVLMIAFDSYSMKHKRRLGLYYKVLRGIRIAVISIPIGRHPLRLCARIAVPVFGRYLKKMIDAHGMPDILHAHFYFQGYIATKCRDIVKCPIVVTEHSSRINKENVDKQISYVAQEAYEGADAVLTVGTALGHWIYEHFGVYPIYVPNVLQADVFEKAKLTNHEGYRFISVGNLKMGKRMDMLIDAFSRAFDGIEDVTLCIFGDGIERENLQKQIIANHLADRVQLFGRAERNVLAQALSESDCFVLASHAETFGVAYIEAMAVGLPVIATKCGGPEDFVTEKCGMLIEKDNINSLTSALAMMREKKGSYNSEQIRRDVLEQFSPQAVASKLLSVYDSLLSRRNGNDTE